MKIKRKPGVPTRSNPIKEPVAPSNKMVQVKDIEKELEADNIKKQWEHYSRVGDSTTVVAKAETIWEYYKRTTGKELEKPIIAIDDCIGKTTEELEELATGHDMNLEGIEGINYRTAIFLYVTGQKKMAYKMISTRHTVMERVDDRVQSQEIV